MEFWGIEVKPGQTIKCDPGEDKYLHLSQASLGETKKDKTSENVPVFVKVNDQKLVIGTLSGDKCPQVQYDLVFETEFELSHSSKSTSIFFVGYRTLASEVDPRFSDSDFDSEDEPIELPQNANGKPEKEGKKDDAKLVSGQVEGLSKKSKVKVEVPKAAKPKPGDDDDEDDDVDDDSTEFDSDSEPEGMPAAMDDDDDDDDSSDEEDEATPKKAEISKKRAAESAPKTPVPEKKAKLFSPSGSQKTGGGKKSVHTATPYPTKQAAKTPANSDKSKPQTPKSGGSGSAATCKSCSRSFSSDHALQAHTKAKHETAK